MTSAKASERYATMSDAVISAVAHGMFRFTSPDQAVYRLESIQSNFVTSRFDADSKTDKNIKDIQPVRLWIRSYHVSEKEEALGYLGNYADILPASLAEGKYTLIARKVDLPLKNHPHKRTLTRSHPNWGHPVLRTLKNKKRIFKTIEDALVPLMQLHEDFPDVTIPNPTKLYAMVYNRKLKPPVQKHVFEIKTHKEGGFYIDYRENTSAKKATNTLETSSTNTNKVGAEKEGDAMDGVHASKIKLERAKKRKRPQPTKVDKADKKE